MKTIVVTVVMIMGVLFSMTQARARKVETVNNSAIEMNKMRGMVQDIVSKSRLTNRISIRNEKF